MKSKADKIAADLQGILDSDTPEVIDAEFYDVVTTLHEEKDYSTISQLYDTQIGRELGGASFEVAYALKMQNRPADARKVYEALVAQQPDNGAALNNLAVIVKENGDLRRACDLIERAYAANPKDDVIVRNHTTFREELAQTETQDKRYRESATKISEENSFVREKLTTFFLSAKSDSDFSQWRLPIANWKFKVLMRTDETKALSLRDQWLKKSYLTRVGRADGYVYLYELNPYVETELKKADSRKIPKNWVDGMNQLSLDRLDELHYFEIKEKLGRVKKKYREILIRDFDDIVLNYLFGNHKATIVLSGSMIEALFLYYCEKKGIQTIAYKPPSNRKSKAVSDADLGDFLDFFDEQKTFSKHVVHLGNVSRLFRNLIHPGKELREQEEPDDQKSNLCFISLSQLIRAIV